MSEETRREFLNFAIGTAFMAGITALAMLLVTLPASRPVVGVVLAGGITLWLTVRGGNTDGA